MAKLLGGFPAAAFGGKAKIMDLLAPLGPVYQAGTLSGNPVAMEAGYQALTMLETPSFYKILEEKTRVITEPVIIFRRKSANPLLSADSYHVSRFFRSKSSKFQEDAKKCRQDLFGQFFRYLFDRGIYVAPSQYEANFVSLAHTHEHLEMTRDAILSFLRQYL